MIEYSNGGVDFFRNVVGECGFYRQFVVKIVDFVFQDYYLGNGCYSLGYGFIAVVGVIMGEVQYFIVGVFVISWVVLFIVYVILVISVVRY